MILHLQGEFPMPVKRLYALFTYQNIRCKLNAEAAAYLVGT